MFSGSYGETVIYKLYVCLLLPNWVHFGEGGGGGGGGGGAGVSDNKLSRGAFRT